MKNTVSTFLSMKQNGERLTEITSYDYTTAKLVEKAGINAILVGDSLGMTMVFSHARTTHALWWIMSSIVTGRVVS